MKTADSRQTSDAIGGSVQRNVRPGDYVLATKYRDGDPLDAWCVGFYKEPYLHCGTDLRHIVVDNDGQSFRGNGYRRVRKISKERGAWIVKNQKLIESSGLSMWHFARCSMKWPNARAHRPRASDARQATQTQSRGSVQPAGSANYTGLSS